ncbi:uridine kinase [Candidatus Bathyarchaeota archaeon]|nr:MAG: uridine kinase [Candidatus Bathyarchaeota archaeon]
MNLRERIKKSGKVFLVGIAGDSGSGKTTFANAIKNILGDLVSSITLDDYHVYDRETRWKLGITPLHPEANNLKLISTHLMLLKKGETIKKPTYDHSTGTFGEWEEFTPTPIVIIEGLHTFYEGLREHLDFKIFVDPARYIKRKWKIRRDVEERGYNFNKVIEEIIKREPDYKRYIDFQKIYADVVIKILPSSLPSIERIAYLTLKQPELYKVRVILREVSEHAEPIKLALDLSALVKASEKDFAIGFFSDYYYEKLASFIDIDGLMNVDIFSALLDELRKEIEEDIEWNIEKYVNAIEVARLLVCWRFLEMIKSKLI